MYVSFKNEKFHKKWQLCSLGSIWINRGTIPKKAQVTGNYRSRSMCETPKYCVRHSVFFFPFFFSRRHFSNSVWHARHARSSTLWRRMADVEEGQHANMEGQESATFAVLLCPHVPLEGNRQLSEMVRFFFFLPSFASYPPFFLLFSFIFFS